MLESHEPSQKGSSILPSAWSFRMFDRREPYPRDACALTWYFRVDQQRKSWYCVSCMVVKQHYDCDNNANYTW